MSTIKIQLLNHLKSSIVKQLSLTIDAAAKSKEFATDKESIAENKYDTKGLEASYLAHGQSKRAMELKKDLDLINQVTKDLLTTKKSVSLYSLVQLEDEDLNKNNYFILPCQGGTKLYSETLNETVIVITPSSPLALKILNKSLSDFFDFPKNGSYQEITIISIV